MNDLHSLVDDKVDDDNDDDHDDESVKMSTCLCDFTDEKFKSKSSTKNRVNNNNDNWPTSPSPIQSRDCSCYCSSSCSCSSITKHSASSQSLKCKDGSLKYPQDSGYCSTNSSNLTTPEGSDVACTEGLCNHSSGMFICFRHRSFFKFCRIFFEFFRNRSISFFFCLDRLRMFITFFFDSPG